MMTNNDEIQSDDILNLTALGHDQPLWLPHVGEEEVIC